MKATAIRREEVLAALAERAPRSMHLMEVVQRLSVSSDRRDDVRDVLDDLRGLGMVTEMPGNRFRSGTRRTRRAPEPSPRDPSTPPGTRSSPDPLPAEPPLRGWLSVTRRGFGFVASEDGGPDAFIPAPAMGDALHGDRVEVSIQASPRGRDGRVLRVLTRGLARVAGRLVRQGSQRWLEPGDPRLPERIEVVGTLPLQVDHNDEVVGLFERYPANGDEGAVRVLAKLGPRGSAAVEVEKVKIREGVEESFSPTVLNEAQKLGTRIRRADRRQRKDLTHLDLLTIDPPDARDHDDAVWASQLPGGGYRVVVAIADVSEYVASGSELDAAARQRGCSIYLPDRVIPMLPAELSSNLASLVPDEDRLALAVDVELGPRGAIRNYMLCEAVIRSRARLAYGDVACALRLTEDGEPSPTASHHRELLTTLYAVSRRLRSRRAQRGSLDFDLPEAHIELDEKSEPVDIRRARREPGLRTAYGMIEDLMLLANELVAAHCVKKRWPAIYRIHPPPDPNRLAVFLDLAAALGTPLDDDFLERPRLLGKFLRDARSQSTSEALNYLLLRAMKQASYFPSCTGHFALATKTYLHFTSPIRRYPDLMVHRWVKQALRAGRPPKVAEPELLQAAAEASRLERRALTVDREVLSIYRLILIKERLGEVFPATVSGLAEHGVFLLLDHPFVEVRIPIDRLGDDWYELDALGLRLVGKRSGHSYQLGDSIQVRLESTSMERREVIASPVHTSERVKKRNSRRGQSRPPHSRKQPGRTRKSNAGSRERRDAKKHPANSTKARRPKRRRAC